MRLFSGNLDPKNWMATFNKDLQKDFQMMMKSPEFAKWLQLQRAANGWSETQAFDIVVKKIFGPHFVHPNAPEVFLEASEEVPAA